METKPKEQEEKLPEEVKPKEKPAKKEKKEKIFIGYHPITEEEVWQ